MLVGQITDRKQMAGVVVFSTRAMVMKEDMATRKCPVLWYVRGGQRMPCSR